MDLMGALVAALAQIAPAGDAEFPEILVPDTLERGLRRIRQGQVVHDRQDVDDGLGAQTGDCGAADVVDSGAVCAQNAADGSRFLRKPLRPDRGPCGDDNVLRHMLRSFPAGRVQDCPARQRMVQSIPPVASSVASDTTENPSRR